jgi:hypothetical protein
MGIFYADVGLANWRRLITGADMKGGQSAPPMLVLRKPFASQLAQPHVPPAAVITTGVAPKMSLKQIQTSSNLKSLQKIIHSSNLSRR